MAHEHAYSGPWSHLGPLGRQDIHYHPCTEGEPGECDVVVVGPGRDCDGKLATHTGAVLPLPDDLVIPGEPVTPEPVPSRDRHRRAGAAGHHQGGHMTDTTELITHYSPAATGRALAGDIHGTLACGAYHWGFVSDDPSLVTCEPCKATLGALDAALEAFAKVYNDPATMTACVAAALKAAMPAIRAAERKACHRIIFDAGASYVDDEGTRRPAADLLWQAEEQP